jgi:hypothetical protein
VDKNYISCEVLRDDNDDLVRGIIMCNAYWVSPGGEMFSVKSTHIEVVIKKPEIFGITHAYIKEVYKKYRETVGLEGKARDEIVESLINKRWMRIRYDKSQDYYIVGFKYFDEKQIDYLRKWGMGILALGEEFAAKIVYINDMKNVLETCNIKQLASDYLYKKFN